MYCNNTYVIVFVKYSIFSILGHITTQYANVRYMTNSIIFRDDRLLKIFDYYNVINIFI